MKKRIILMSVAILCVCIATIGGAVAYFTESKEVKNIITTTSLGVGIGEDKSKETTISDVQMVPGVKFDKSVYIKNTEKETEYVKVTITKYWAANKQDDCSVRAKELLADKIILNTINEDDWIIMSGEEIDDENNETMILFYKKPLVVGAKTSNVIDSINVASLADNSYADGNIHLDIEVDSVQKADASEAILSEWGLEVKIAEDGSLEEIVY